MLAVTENEKIRLWQKKKQKQNQTKTFDYLCRFFIKANLIGFE